MQLLVIRHAIAEDREEFARTGADDDLRPLTAEGKKKMRKGARGLRELVDSIDVLAASPLVRAAETAAIVSAAYGDMPVVTVPSLDPDAEPESFLAWLRTEHRVAVVAVVGHEPHLGMLVTWLLTGAEDSCVTLRKGGACLIEFENEPAKATGTLCWAATPSMLRSLKDND